MSCFKLNPVNSRNSIAKKVKAIRESLDDISKDMAQFNFVTCLNEEPISNMRRDQGILVDSKNVIGREEDKTAILEMLAKESDKVPTVIAIVGIGGMGKSTLAQLVYDNLEDSFQNRWYACISDTSDEKEVIGKILRSIRVEKDYRSFDVHELQIEIRKSIVGKKFLLVLDDVWDHDRSRWLGRISLLSGGAKGSKVVVTTRSPLVAMAVGALETHNLEGLSDVDSWDLFKSVAFLPGDENDPRREIVGREIVKKCRNVPLAIRSIASLLFEKHTIVEWENLKNQELSNLEEQRSAQEYSILPVLKVSYHHLRSNLKHCFAYCSLFPEDFRFNVRKLIDLWISQGYIKPNVDSETLEQAGHSYFMHLLRRGFFQEASTNEIGEVVVCKMHDLIHDLARHVAGEESKMLTSTSFNASNCVRHVSLRDSIDYRWVIPTQLGNGNKLRSFLYMKDLDRGRRVRSLNLDQLCANFKLLRSLDLSWSGIESVPSCIGELKHLRYLDLSWNNFEILPDSMTNLLNLLTLHLQSCDNLKALPENFRKLINLRCLNIYQCYRLKHMPVGIGELTCLQYLSSFKVGKAESEADGVKSRNGLDALAGLELKGRLDIEFEGDWDGDECSWQLPVSVEELMIYYYPGKKIPDWGMNGRTNNVASLYLLYCRNVINLPLLSCLANLRILQFFGLSDLEFVEESSSNSCIAVAGSPFFPSLEVLRLIELPKLKGWWWRTTATTSSPLFPSQFPALRKLAILNCPELESIPLCPRLRELEISGNEVIEQVLSSPASTAPPSSSCFREILAAIHLQKLRIWGYKSLEILHVVQPQLLRLDISGLPGLKKLHIAHPNVLEELIIWNCPELELWEEDKRGVDWDSLSNIRHLRLRPLPPPEKLLQCLPQRQALGQLQITDL